MSTLAPAPKLRNPFPSIDLKRAYDYLKKVKNNIPGQDRLERKVLIVQGLGIKEGNSNGDNVVGSLAHYSLVHRVILSGRTYYQITDEAKDLLAVENNREKWKELAMRLATNPVLFAFLASEYPDGNLPLEVSGRLIRKYPEVTNKNVGAITHRYTESIKFAKEGPGDLNPLSPDSKADNVNVFTYLHPPVSSRGIMDFPYPLGDGTQVTLTLPTTLSKRDSEKITRYFNALIESLTEE